MREGERKQPMVDPQRAPRPQRASGSMRAVVKVEKLTQIALALPASLLVGWLAGAGLDRLLHSHWIYIAGLVVGAVAGFVQIIRLVADPGLLASTAYDPSAAPGPGFDDASGANRSAKTPAGNTAAAKEPGR